jgi:amino acid transporter
MSLTEHSQNTFADHVVEQSGYHQEFHRDLKRFASFAVGFSFISITTGIFTTYGSVLNWGGPLGIWTWPLVVLGQLFVALVFALFASRVPLAGYSYQWVSRLFNPKVGWLIGWLSFIFLAVVVVSVDYSIAQTVLPSLFGYTETPQNAWIATAIVLLVQMGLILFSTVWTTRINNAAVGTELVGIIGLTVLLLIVGAVRGMLHPGNLFSMGSVSSAGYFNLGSLTKTGPFMISFLLGAYTIVGFEAAANLAEETENPHRVVPFAMWTAVVLSGVVGFIFLIALNLASQNVPALAASATPVADIVNGVLGHVIGAILLVIVTFSIFACGLVIFMTNTRLVWAMARDGRFPGHTLFRRVNTNTRTPVPSTVLVGVLCQLILGVFAGIGIFANQTNTLANLFGASTLLPAIIYFVTVIFYIVLRRRLPHVENAFSLGIFEWPVIVLALAWLLWELAIFRDAQFATPWLYCLVMFGIGVLYFIWMLVTRPNALASLPAPETAPAD